MHHPKPLIPIAALCSVLAACGDPGPPHARFMTQLHARSTSGEPIAGVRFWADGRALGATSANGELRAELSGHEGATVALTAACPPAYRTPVADRRLVLQRLHPAGGSPGAVDLELTQLCEPIERAAALVVLASGDDSAGLPIRIDGELVGQTDSDGTAHLTLGEPPHASVRVELDTREHPGLLPRNPVHSFRLEDEDSVLLLEQTFNAAPLRRPAAAPRARAVPRRPQRIE